MTRCCSSSRCLVRREIGGESLSSCETSTSSDIRCSALFLCFPQSVILTRTGLFSSLIARIDVFSSLAEYSDENMMDASNLASCLAPSLMPIPEEKDQVQFLSHTIELLRTTIIHHDEIFPSDGNGPVYEKFLLILPMYVSLLSSVSKHLSLSLVSSGMAKKTMKTAKDHCDDQRVMKVNRTLGIRPSTDGVCCLLASQDSDYCTEDLNLLNETDV